MNEDAKKERKLMEESGFKPTNQGWSYEAYENFLEYKGSIENRKEKNSKGLEWIKTTTDIEKFRQVLIELFNKDFTLFHECCELAKDNWNIKSKIRSLEKELNELKEKLK